MLLVIDVGNTNMVFGLFRGERLEGSFRLKTDANSTSDELGLYLCEYFQRFGLRLAYLALDKKKYTDMVIEMCRRMDLPYTEEQLRVEANRWELQHGGRTPRVAMQLVEKLAGTAEKMQNS